MKTTLRVESLSKAISDGYEINFNDIFHDMKRRECKLLEFIPAKKSESSVDKNGINTTMHYSDQVRWEVIETGRTHTGTLNNLYRQFTYKVEVL